MRACTTLVTVVLALASCLSGCASTATMIKRTGQSVSSGDFLGTVANILFIPIAVIADAGNAAGLSPDDVAAVAVATSVHQQEKKGDWQGAERIRKSYADQKAYSAFNEGTTRKLREADEQGRTLGRLEEGQEYDARVCLVPVQTPDARIAASEGFNGSVAKAQELQNGCPFPIVYILCLDLRGTSCSRHVSDGGSKLSAIDNIRPSQKVLNLPQDRLDQMAAAREGAFVVCIWPDVKIVDGSCVRGPK